MVCFDHLSHQITLGVKLIKIDVSGYWHLIIVHRSRYILTWIKTRFIGTVINVIFDG